MATGRLFAELHENRANKRQPAIVQRIGFPNIFPQNGTPFCGVGTQRQTPCDSEILLACWDRVNRDHRHLLTESVWSFDTKGESLLIGAKESTPQYEMFDAGCESLGCRLAQQDRWRFQWQPSRTVLVLSRSWSAPKSRLSVERSAWSLPVLLFAMLCFWH